MHHIFNTIISKTFKNRVSISCILFFAFSIKAQKLNFNVYKFNLTNQNNITNTNKLKLVVSETVRKAQKVFHVLSFPIKTIRYSTGWFYQYSSQIVILIALSIPEVLFIKYPTNLNMSSPVLNIIKSTNRILNTEQHYYFK